MIRAFMATALGRWVTGAVVTALLGTAAIMWHNHKENLRDEGAEECVQEINQATIDELEAALAAERSAVAELRANLAAVAAANEEATKRRVEAEKLSQRLRRQIEEQKKNDQTYREWTASDLPDGVAERLREADRGEAGS